MVNKEKNRHFLSTSELAKLLKISTVAVFKKIKKGQIPAQKIGRSYGIAMDDVNAYIDGSASKRLTEPEKEEIKQAVKKIIKEYGETLKLLGRE